MKNERVSEPAHMRFKLAWSTNFECGKNCKDPRHSWEEEIDQKVLINTGVATIETYMFCKRCNL